MIRRVMLVSFITALPTLGLVGPVPAALGATISPTVFTDDLSTNGNCTLREAIVASNTDDPVDQCPEGSGVDTISLKAGTYVLTVEGGGEALAASGDLDIYSSANLTGAGPGQTVIDGNWTMDPDRILEIYAAGTQVTISGITVTDGDPSMGVGGMLTDTDTSVTVTDAEFINNLGGGILNNGPLTMSRVIVSGNKGANYGGGITNNGGFMTLQDVAVLGNEATFDGGGMYSYRATMANVTIAGNSARNGGGLELDGANTLTNVTISGNFANESGGAIDLDGNGPQVLNNVTITGNVADADGNGSGDAGGLWGYSENVATVRNSVIAGNIDRGGQAPDCSQEMPDAFISGGHNLIGNTTGCTFTSGTGDLLNMNPMLGPLADNGGFTMTHALLMGSPAINTGGADAAPTDQRNLPRNPDIGAYELVLCAKVPVNRIGTEGNDTAAGTSGPDGILGLGGKDKLSGLGGNDGLCGGGGKDTLKGGGGKDNLRGEAGKDTCLGGGGRDKAVCEKERKIP